MSGGHTGLAFTPPAVRQKVRADAPLTRPNNTTAYAAGQVIGEDPARVMSFAAPTVGMTVGYVELIQGANQATKLQWEVWVFSSAVAAQADQAAFAPSLAELQFLIGRFRNTTAPVVANPGAGAAGSVIHPVATTMAGTLPVALTTRTVYGVATALNAYTPVANEVFYFSIGFSALL